MSRLHRRLACSLAAALVLAAVAACGGTSGSRAETAAPASSATRTATTTETPPVVHRVVSHRLRDHLPAAVTPAWQRLATIGGHPALWIAERSGVTLVRMDQRLVHLALHAGTEDPGGTGWRYGNAVAGREIHHLVLGFNGGFKFITNPGGFESFGRIGVPLQPGLGSIVTYRNGRTQIGAWDGAPPAVPAHGVPIASVRQNLRLLIDHGRPDSSVDTCGTTCWGATVGGDAVARSGLGILGNGQLVWAAGEGLTVAQIADAMAAAGVQRGVQLDINPDWVAGYLYVHHRTAPLTPVPVVPGQYGISGDLLAPYSRDFFTVLTN